MKIELPTGYYLNNFRVLIGHVIDKYEDLLSPEEVMFYQTFYGLDEDAQKLYVRMLSRKGRQFRASKLRYAEIKSTQESAKLLSTFGLINTDTSLEINDVLLLFNAVECIKLAKCNGFSHEKDLKGKKRKELDSALMDFFSTGENPLRLDEPIYSLSNPEIFETIKLLFFGNPHQDLTEFVLRDLGLYQYEKYKIDKITRAFETREQIENHTAFFDITEKLNEILDDEVEKNNAITLYAFYNNIPFNIQTEKTLQHPLYKLYFRIARQLERLECFEQAIEIYRRCNTPDARQRLARVLVKVGDIEDALALCQLLKNDPLNEEEAIFAADFYFRTAKKYGKVVSAPDKYAPKESQVLLPKSETVEIAAQEYFSSQGHCEYVENSLFCSVFGLFYWNLIFAPAKGAFSHPFQYRPHDLYRHDFLEIRRHAFDGAQCYLANAEAFRNHILGIWDGKQGLASPFVFWGTLQKPVLELALDRIPRDHWSAIFKRMWTDVKQNRSGFPDLILFPEEGSYELIEIKGPGDKLQKNQTRWMHYFHEHHIPHLVCHVDWR